MLEKILHTLGPQGTQLLFMAFGLVVIYLFMIRPKYREEQLRRDFFANLRVGTPVITIGGLHGRVVKLQGSTVVLEMAPGSTRIVVEKRVLLPKNEEDTRPQGR